MLKVVDNKTRTVLVVEDDLINRTVLAEILSPYYIVLQAGNGKEGLDILKENREKISLVLLDICMPVMDGYQFLDEVSQDEQLMRTPIIVTTSSSTATDEIKCLEKGAVDFVAKPYNPSVVLRRVASKIRFRELSAIMDQVEYDRVTGFYNRNFFIVNVEKTLQATPMVSYDMLCVNMLSFRVLQNRYGVEACDQCLVSLAKEMQTVFGKRAIIGRLSNGIFGILNEHHEKEFYESCAEILRSGLTASEVPTAVIQMGICSEVGHDEHCTTLFDRAFISIENMEYQYGRQVGEYTDTMKEKKERQSKIFATMEDSLRNGHFQVYYQPKYDCTTQEICGAEALVRWIHPECGFMSPADFIPVFEDCGFITELDLYMADKVCSDLRQWLDEGKKVVPISCNFSRVDFKQKDLAEQIEKIADRYNVPHHLVHPEVTESACMDNMAMFTDTISALRKAGFVIELDDFGTGYSSLTVLSSFDVDVLKLDMVFARSLDSEKQQIILNHIFSIAKSMDMKVVAEGIETEEQNEVFREMGCDYGQGYFFSRPLPKQDFEPYIT